MKNMFVIMSLLMSQFASAQELSIENDKLIVNFDRPEINYISSYGSECTAYVDFSEYSHLMIHLGIDAKKFVRVRLHFNDVNCILLSDLKGNKSVEIEKNITVKKVYCDDSTDQTAGNSYFSDYIRVSARIGIHIGHEVLYGYIEEARGNCY